MEKNDWLSISRDSFYKTSMYLYENVGFNIESSASLIVNEAITCELSIKTILGKLNIPYENTHSLFDLLGLLPTDIQSGIITTISNTLNHPVDVVLKDIQIFSFAVVDWRYWDQTMIIEFNTLHQLMLVSYSISRKYICFEITPIDSPTSEKEVDEKFIESSIKALNQNAQRILKERKRYKKKLRK